ncbi:MAG: hypothetical protein AAF666_05890 [Pseudomonadota bacterium]
MGLRPAQKTMRAIDATDFSDYVANFFRRRALQFLSTGLTAAFASLVIGKKFVPFSFRSVLFGSIAVVLAGFFTFKFLRRKQDLNRATTLHLNNLKDFKQRREARLYMQLWQEMRAHMIPAHRDVTLPGTISPFAWDDIPAEVQAFIEREIRINSEDAQWPCPSRDQMIASLTHFVMTHQSLRQTRDIDAHELELQLGYQTTVIDEWMDQIMRAGGVSKYAKYDSKIQHILGITRGRAGTFWHTLLHPEDSSLLDRFTKNRILVDMVHIVDDATRLFIPRPREAPPGVRYRRFSLLDCLDFEDDQRSNLIRCFGDAERGHDIADFFSAETKKALGRTFSFNPDTMAEHVFFMFLADIKLGLRCRISVDPLFTISRDFRRYVEHIEARYHVKILDEDSLSEAETDTAKEVALAENFVDTHFPDASSSQRRAFVIAYHMDFKVGGDSAGIKTLLNRDLARENGHLVLSNAHPISDKVRYIFTSEALFFKLLNSSRQFFALSCRMHPDTYFDFFHGIITHETKPVVDFMVTDEGGADRAVRVVLKTEAVDGLKMNRAKTAERLAEALKCPGIPAEQIRETETTVSFMFNRARSGKRASMQWIENRLQANLNALIAWEVDREAFKVSAPTLPLEAVPA